MVDDTDAPKLSEADEAELQRLEAAATPGPWIAVRCGNKTWGIGRPGNNGGIFFKLQCMYGTLNTEHNRADATLLLEARNALPLLLAERERLLPLAEHCDDFRRERDEAVLALRRYINEDAEASFSRIAREEATRERIAELEQRVTQNSELAGASIRRLGAERDAARVNCSEAQNALDIEEGRANTLDVELSAARERIAELEAALSEARASIGVRS